MEQLTLKLQPKYVGKMQTLINVFGDSDLFVDKFFDYHINRLKREIARMQFAINKYEIKYNMKSDIFYQKIETGELGDDKDFVMWSGIYELLLDSKKQLSQLL
ncbi:MAG: hypothetical protein HY738_21930 [Bacteroidia bacterium]|nr:hypothetical protein [Bacteroidia bacterium]